MAVVKQAVQVIERLDQAAGLRGQVGDGFRERVRGGHARQGQSAQGRARRKQSLLGRARRGDALRRGSPFRPPAENRSCRPQLGTRRPGAPTRRAVWITSGGWCGADEAGDGGVAAQLIQAAAALGPDAADRDAQPGADLRVGQRGVGDE